MSFKYIFTCFVDLSEVWHFKNLIYGNFKMHTGRKIDVWVKSMTV